jgi:hypothetical protein
MSNEASVHESIVLLHENMFKNIDKQLGELIDADKLRNGRWDEHLKTSVDYRIKVDRHEDRLNELSQLRWWLAGTIVTIISAIITWSVQWGATMKQIEVNTLRLDKIESIHFFQQNNGGGK